MSRVRKVATRKLNGSEREARAEARALVETYDALNRLGIWSQRRVLRALLDRLELKLSAITREQ